MALSSVLNLSVAGSDGGNGNQALLMPKLQYRFRVEFFDFGIDADGPLALTRQVVDCARPQVQFQDITLNVYNSQIYMAGKHSWQPLTINIRDDAAGTVSRAVGQQLQKQLDFANQASAPTASDYKFSTYVSILDGGNGAFIPTILETWELYGCYLQTANYQTLNYGTSDVVTIALTLRYDNAVQTPDGTGVGADVGFPATATTGSTTQAQT